MTARTARTPTPLTLARSRFRPRSPPLPAMRRLPPPLSPPRLPLTTLPMTPLARSSPPSTSPRTVRSSRLPLSRSTLLSLPPLPRVLTASTAATSTTTSVTVVPAFRCFQHERQLNPSSKHLNGALLSSNIFHDIMGAIYPTNTTQGCAFSHLEKSPDFVTGRLP